jgi:TPR repeat protein
VWVEEFLIKLWVFVGLPLLCGIAWAQASPSVPAWLTHNPMSTKPSPSVTSKNETTITIAGAKAFLREKNYRALNEHLLPLARDGNIWAQKTLGADYFNGRGVPISFKKAAYWYHLAAEQGDALAARDLGDVYDNESPHPNDGSVRSTSQLMAYQAKAEHWYRIAAKEFQRKADQGDSQGEVELGNAYTLGQGVPLNYKKAAYWYRRAANQGDEQGEAALGFAYEIGQGVALNYKKAVYWYRRAADQGDKQAVWALQHLSTVMPPPSAVSVPQSEALWSYAHQDSVYSIIGTAGRNKLIMEVPVTSRHFSLIFEITGPRDFTSKSSPVSVTFNGGQEFSFKTDYSYNDTTSSNIFSAPLPDAEVRAWTHDFTALETATVAFPGSAIPSWKISLSGTTPTVTAMAKAMNDEGLTDLPAPWGPSGNDGSPREALPAQSLSGASPRSVSAMTDQRARTLLDKALSQDPSALNSLQSSAYSGNSNAELTLGGYYCRKSKPNYKECSIWVKKAAAKGNINAEMALFENYESDAHWWTEYYIKVAHGSKEDAKQADAAARLALGEGYYLSHDIIRDRAKAALWIKRAASQGYPQAEFDLSLLYLFGRGVPENFAKAFNLDQPLASEGSAAAEYVVGTDYYFGRGVKKDDQEALYWFLKAARQGYQPSPVFKRQIDEAGVWTQRSSK